MAKTKSNDVPEIRTVSPNDCVGQKKNARYFTPERFQQLVDNIKADGRLESTPLVYDDKGVIRIISGHHRIEAARQAKLDKIVVMVIKPKSKDEIISKQLSHNSLVGKDDQMLLSELFNEISDIQKKLESGISSDIGNIDYVSLNFKIGQFKELVLMFAPDSIERFTSVMDEIEKHSIVKHQTTVRIADIKIFDKFADNMCNIKKNQNIKSNAVALEFMTDIVEKWLKENQE